MAWIQVRANIENSIGVGSAAVYPVPYPLRVGQIGCNTGLLIKVERVPSRQSLNDIRLFLMRWILRWSGIEDAAPAFIGVGEKGLNARQEAFRHRKGGRISRHLVDM